MTEALDAYADQFLITIGPFGAHLSFLVSQPHQDPSKPLPATNVATIRMSVEHAKVMIMIIKRHIKKIEEQTGVQAKVSNVVLNQLGVSPEDWEDFWK